LRTYYTSKIASSPDVTYNVIIMGLWTWAEITTGIIVSCLPVIPKFFQHFGPRVYQTLFSSSSKSDTGLGPKSESTDAKNKIEVSVQFERRLDIVDGDVGDARLEAWCDSTHPHVHAQQRSEYIGLAEADVSVSGNDPTGERRQGLAQIRAARRDDLETGHYAPRYDGVHKWM
jgi:hypothetical protein